MATSCRPRVCACCYDISCGAGGQRPCYRKRKPRPKATPLPLLKLIVLCSTVFINEFGVSMIFPFLPFMIHDFFPYLDKTELGGKAGYLGSSYYIGNLIGSLFWGLASDRLGRRPTLLFGVCAITATEFLFGFSQNFVWAIIARLLWGLLNGVFGIAKTYISEICDDTNQAQGFAFLGTSGGIAILLGAMTGGFLAQPASKYSILEIGFFCKYPYSLPCIVGGSLGICSLLCSWLFLDESLKKPISTGSNADFPDDTSDNSSDSPCSSESGIELQQANEECDSSLLISRNGDKSSDADKNERELSEFEDSESASGYDVSSDTGRVREKKRFSISEHFIDYKKKCLQTFSFTKLVRLVVYRITDCIGGFVTCALCFYSFDYAQLKPGNFKDKASGCGHGLVRGLRRGAKLMLDRKVFLSISLYAAIAFLSILSNELLPLLVVTSHEHGGYDMDDSEIGIVLMTSAIAQLLFQFFVFPQITKCIGYRHTYKLGCALYGISIVLLPLSNRISGPISSSDDISSGSGLGSGSGLDIVDNSTDFCGIPLYASDNVTDTSTNVNSVSRVPARVWVVLLSIHVGIIVSTTIALTSVTVLVGNSTLPATRGTVNGFGQATASFGRMVGPIIISPLFACSETAGKGWPLNYHLAFDLTAVGTVGAILLSFLLPASIERKRDTPTVLIESTSDVEDISEPS